MKIRSTQLIAISALATLCLAGCSGNGLETVPVYGKVTFAGREHPKVCRLFFQSLESSGPSRPSIAKVEEDGAFEVKAFRRADGLIPGKYRVKVAYYDLKPGANPGFETSWIEQQFDAGELVVEASSRGVEHNIEVRPTRTSGRS